LWQRARIQQPAPEFKAKAVVGQELKTVSLRDYQGMRNL
jgi:alkyl hydroperoxide reductase subunit AhpC